MKNNFNLKQYNKKYVDIKKVGLFKKVETKNNKILSRNIKLSLDGFKTKRNNNTFVLASDDESIAADFIIPNVLQGNNNYVIMDNGGVVYEQTHEFLKKEGYDIQVLNLDSNSSIQSLFFNPLLHIDSKQEIEEFVDVFLQSSRKILSSEPLVNESERMFLVILINYMRIAAKLLKVELTSENIHLNLLFDLFTTISDARDNHPQSPFQDIEFLMDIICGYEAVSEELKGEMMSYFTQLIKLPFNIAHCTLLQTAIHLQILTINHIQEIISNDSFDIDMSDGKKAIFIILPAEDFSFDPIAAMFISQIIDYNFNNLLNKASIEYNPTQFFINLNRSIYVPQLEHRMITGRKINQNFNVICESMEILRSFSPEYHELILHNADSLLYLGCSDKETHQWISEYILDGTITPDLIALLPTKICIVSVRGEFPIFDPTFSQP